MNTTEPWLDTPRLSAANDHDNAPAVDWRVRHRLTGRHLNFAANESIATARDYERAVFDQALVSTRAGSWHDWFNADRWQRWPWTKSIINSLHLRELSNPDIGDNARTPLRDLLTLLDESGVVVVSRSRAGLAAIANQQWQRAFVQQRSVWTHDCHALILGHGLMEQLQRPYLGLTAKAVLLWLPEGRAKSARACQARIDRALAFHLALGRLHCSGDLSPLPVLGIPGWHPAQNKAFYANTDYFRSRRRGRRASRILTINQQVDFGTPA